MYDDWAGSWADLFSPSLGSNGVGIGLVGFEGDSPAIWIDYDDYSHSAYLAATPLREIESLDYDVSVSYSYCVHLGNLQNSEECSTSIPFLDLPFDYSASNFYEESMDTKFFGKIDSYFDHEYPTYCSTPNTGGCSTKDYRAVNYRGVDGGVSDPQPSYNVTYNGHDGFDFKLKADTPVLAAAAGRVTYADDSGWPAGKIVVIEHPNGYKTEYWHLNSITDGILDKDVSRDTLSPIGRVGSTGNSEGPHLHFKVINPSGNVVDPFGWSPSPEAAFYGEADPWEKWNLIEDGSDAASHYLWIHRLVTNANLLSSESSTILSSPSGKIIATFPVGVNNEALRVQMMDILNPANIPGNQILASFSLYGYTNENLAVTAMLKDISLDVQLSTSSQLTQKVNSSNDPNLILWDIQARTWKELPSTWDPSSGSLHTSTSQIGTFAIIIPEYYMYLPIVNN